MVGDTERGSSRWNRSKDRSTEGLHSRSMEAEMEIFQSNSSSETMNQGQGRPSEALVPYGRIVAGYPEPESPVPTVEEVCQQAGALEGAYHEGVQSDSDADFPPEDPGMWVRRKGSVNKYYNYIYIYSFVYTVDVSYVSRSLFLSSLKIPITTMLPHESTEKSPDGL